MGEPSGGRLAIVEDSDRPGWFHLLGVGGHPDLVREGVTELQLLSGEGVVRTVRCELSTPGNGLVYLGDVPRDAYRQMVLKQPTFASRMAGCIEDGIQAAIDISDLGDTVLVEFFTDGYSIVEMKRRVTVRAEGLGTPTIRSTDNQPAVLFPADTDTLTLLRGIEVDGTGTLGAIRSYGGARIENCVITGDSVGVICEVGSSVQVWECTFKNLMIGLRGDAPALVQNSTADSCVVAIVAQDSMIVDNCTIVRATGIGVDLLGSSTVTNTTISCYSWAVGVQCASGTSSTLSGVNVSGAFVGVQDYGSVVMENCTIDGGQTGAYGASGSSSSLQWNTFKNLTAGVVDDGSATIQNCTAESCNIGYTGLASTQFQNSIATNCSGYGFIGGQVSHCIAPEGFNSYVSLVGTSTSDPLYCGSGEYTLRVDSYGNPENNASGQLIGAYPVRCMYGSLVRDAQFTGGVLDLIGDTTVPSGKTLTFGPGAFVEADTANYGGSGDIELIVRGVLRAKGTAQDTVKFYGQGGTEPWDGIRLDASGGGDKVILDYVHIQNANVGVADTGNPPADSLVIRNCRLDEFGYMAVEAIGNGTGPGLIHIEDSVIGMEGADTGIFISGSGQPDYSTLIRNVTVTGDATGVYGIALGTEGSGGSPAVVDTVSVSGLTTGVGILLFDASPELGVGTITGCKTGVEVAVGGPTVGPASGMLSLVNCTTGLLVSGDALDVTVRNLDITSPSGGIGVYTDDSVTGSFTGLAITGGGTGFKAYSDTGHTLRSSEITEFTTIGVSIASNGMIHLGDGYSDQGGNSIYASGTSPPKYINSKNRIGG